MALSPCRELYRNPRVPSKRRSMVISPAPTAVRSSVMNERILGRRFLVHFDRPGQVTHRRRDRHRAGGPPRRNLRRRSPRPPRAARCFWIISSAVWARAGAAVNESRRTAAQPASRRVFMECDPEQAPRRILPASLDVGRDFSPAGQARRAATQSARDTHLRAIGRAPATRRRVRRARAQSRDQGPSRERPGPP